MKKIIAVIGLCLVVCLMVDVSNLGSRSNDAQNNETNLMVLAGYHGYAGSVDGEGSDATISLTKNDRQIELDVVAEVPASLRIYRGDSQTNQLTYQGHGADHQFSDQALICNWGDHRIYMNQQEYDDFCEALDES